MIFNVSAEPALVLCDFRIANMPLTFKKHQTTQFALGTKIDQMWSAVHCFKQNYVFFIRVWQECGVHSLSARLCV